jgi:hypothetical protein
MGAACERRVGRRRGMRAACGRLGRMVRGGVAAPAPRRAGARRRAGGCRPEWGGVGRRGPGRGWGNVGGRGGGWPGRRLEPAGHGGAPRRQRPGAPRAGRGSRRGRPPPRPPLRPAGARAGGRVRRRRGRPAGAPPTRRARAHGPRGRGHHMPAGRGCRLPPTWPPPPPAGPRSALRRTSFSDPAASALTGEGAGAPTSAGEVAGLGDVAAAIARAAPSPG